MSTTIAAYQLAPRIGDLAGNRERLVAAVRQAAAAGADLLVLPELATSGYVFASAAEARELAEPVDGPTAQLLAGVCRETGLTVVYGFPEAAGEVVFNAAAVVDGSGVLAAYRKAHLWGDEPDWSGAGDERPPVVQTAFGRLGLAVCYDLEFPEWVRLAATDVDVLCVPTNWPASARPPGERPIETANALVAGALNRVFVVAADRVGTERGVPWVGGSVIGGPDGYSLAIARPGDTEQLLVATVDLAQARDKRVGDRNDRVADRRGELYRRAGADDR
ncbi:carbon-nitrogen hydrolase [Flexivirga sp. ID2601S]|uniref:Carbon-nitrogen hydrolase n=1 Tax=Flexivirga aerilata TaxID=1656889 RepID=A0A849AET6_9MICO|nr:carbon-nitrogen hydrolase [Flexivirga aerilata]